jgi:replicative DNA helicase
MTISLEMPKNQLMQRIFSIRYWVRKKDFDKWSPEIVMDKLVKWWHVEDYMKLPDYIYLSTGKSIDADIYNIIYRSHYRDWVSVFIIDYIGLMSTSTKQQSRAYEIGYISGKLKQISMELWVHIVILSQINRSGANRPKLEDLKDSWSLEQDADYVIWLQNEKDEKWLTNQLDVLVLKNRNWIVRDISYKQIWLKVTNEIVK